MQASIQIEHAKVVVNLTDIAKQAARKNHFLWHQYFSVKESLIKKKYFPRDDNVCAPRSDNLQSKYTITSINKESVCSLDDGLKAALNAKDLKGASIWIYRGAKLTDDTTQLLNNILEQAIKKGDVSTAGECKKLGGILTSQQLNEGLRQTITRFDSENNSSYDVSNWIHLGAKQEACDEEYRKLIQSFLDKKEIPCIDFYFLTEIVKRLTSNTNVTKSTKNQALDREPFGYIKIECPESLPVSYEHSLSDNDYIKILQLWFESELKAGNPSNAFDIFLLAREEKYTPRLPLAIGENPSLFLIKKIKNAAKCKAGAKYSKYSLSYNIEKWKKIYAKYCDQPFKMDEELQLLLNNQGKLAKAEELIEQGSDTDSLCVAARNMETGSGQTILPSPLLRYDQLEEKQLKSINRLKNMVESKIDWEKEKMEPLKEVMEPLKEVLENIKDLKYRINQESLNKILKLLLVCDDFYGLDSIVTCCLDLVNSQKQEDHTLTITPRLVKELLELALKRDNPRLLEVCLNQIKCVSIDWEYCIPYDQHELITTSGHTIAKRRLNPWSDSTEDDETDPSNFTACVIISDIKNEYTANSIFPNFTQVLPETQTGTGSFVIPKNNGQPENQPIRIRMSATQPLDKENQPSPLLKYNLKELQKFSNSGGDIDTVDENGDTALLIAVRRLDTKGIKKLLVSGANINHENRVGETALTILFGKIGQYKENKDTLMKSLNFLLENKANPNQQNKDGNTVLHSFARYYGADTTLTFIELLLTYGANVNIQNNDGETMLHKAAKHINENALQLLFTKAQPKPDLRIQNRREKNPFVSMIFGRNLAAIKYCVNLDPDIAAISPRGSEQSPRNIAYNKLVNLGGFGSRIIKESIEFEIYKSIKDSLADSILIYIKEGRHSDLEALLLTTAPDNITLRKERLEENLCFLIGKYLNQNTPVKEYAETLKVLKSNDFLISEVLTEEKIADILLTLFNNNDISPSDKSSRLNLLQQYGLPMKKLGLDTKNKIVTTLLQNAEPDNLNWLRKLLFDTDALKVDIKDLPTVSKDCRDVTAQNLEVVSAAISLQPSKINEEFLENVVLPPQNEQLRRDLNQQEAAKSKPEVEKKRRLTSCEATDSDSGIPLKRMGKKNPLTSTLSIDAKIEQLSLNTIAYPHVQYLVSENNNAGTNNERLIERAEYHRSTVKILPEEDVKMLARFYGMKCTDMQILIRDLEERIGLVNAELVNNNGETALMLAARNGSLNAISFLLERGIDIDQQDNQGFTALHRAVEQGHLSCVELLVSRGAKLDLLTSFPAIPALNTAASKGFTQIVQLLVKKGANIGITSGQIYKVTPLHSAAKEGHLETVKYLVTAGADINHLGYGYTPLCHAARSGHIGVVSFFIEKGADLKAGRHSPLAMAVKYGHCKTTKLLEDPAELLTLKVEEPSGASNRSFLAAEPLPNEKSATNNEPLSEKKEKDELSLYNADMEYTYSDSEGTDNEE